MSILELARIVTTPDNLRQLHQVAQLHALEREMMLGRLKREALVRLAELTEEVPAASADEVRASEVMRKACVDLLRYGESSSSGPISTRSQSPPPATTTLSPLGEEKVLAFLEQLGEEKYEDEPYEPRAQASGPVELAGWSKAEPQATREDVREVEITHDAQVGMAFGKTSDHGTEPYRTRTRRVPPGDTRTGGTPVPPASHRGITSSDTRRTPTGIPSTENRQRKPDNGKLLDDAHPP
ncbi:MAG: hypothetical protein IIB54_15680 [Planctomycetes bacterium]|nr:hypothetical protein [Planctomycetota bacterium]